VMIDKLEKLKLVSRKQNQNDRRSYTLNLTHKGANHYKKHHTHHYNLTQDIISSLNKGEIKIFANCLKKIVNSL
jgi:DNA-binding MarR family transcriptional regulator